MICFQTRFQKLYNHVIHNFLSIEVYNGDTDVGDIIEIILPKYLYREQYQKCVKTFREIYDWTEDKFYHDMSAFHEIVLYKFICYMAEFRDDFEDFDDFYYDEEGRQLIGEAVRFELEEDEGASLEEIENYFYDVGYWVDSLFIDTDFLFIDKLYNQRRLGNTSIEEILGINIDYYYEILPLDIQEKYKSGHITLTGEVVELLDFIQDRINHGSLYKLFFENGKKINEDKIQVILENLMDFYFANRAVEITREALLGSGKVDFKLYKNGHEDEKLLIEVKKADSSYLKKGYERQLVEYMKSSSYKNAFYLIVCFTDEEYEKAYNFIRNHVYTDKFQLYINIMLLDVRKKVSASRGINSRKVGDKINN